MAYWVDYSLCKYLCLVSSPIEGILACEVAAYIGRASIYNFNLMFVYS